MGGEPTLHPRFVDMVDELARRGRRTVVFSNAAARLEEAVVRRTVAAGVRWVVNCNPPESYCGDQLSVLRRHLELLGEAACITFNLTDGETPYGHVLEYIERFGLARSVKVGVALPTLEHRNEYVGWDALPAIARQLMRLHGELRARDIGLEFECGVPYCLFDEDQRAQLGDTLISHCGSRLDITPGGDVINCLPLCAAAAVPFGRFRDYGEARDWFQRMQAPYRQAGSEARCLLCTHRLAGHCSACLAHGMAGYNRIALPPLPAEPASFLK
jgi:hypothetical protein